MTGPNFTRREQVQTHCEYCDDPFNPDHYGTTRTKDHIVPRAMSLSVGLPAMGGRENFAAACGRCNAVKANMLPDAMRAMAAAFRDRADLIDKIADRAAAMIVERKLLP